MRDEINKILATRAWSESNNGQSSIDDVASAIASKTGQPDNSQGVHNMILGGLDVLDDGHKWNLYGSMGQVDFDGVTVYWWCAAKLSAWTINKPDWWDQQLLDWELWTRPVFCPNQQGEKVS